MRFEISIFFCFASDISFLLIPGLLLLLSLLFLGKDDPLILNPFVIFGDLFISEIFGEEIWPLKEGRDGGDKGGRGGATV